MPSGVSEPQPAGTKSARRDNCFDFLRLFAALSVVVGHVTEHFNIGFLWLKPHGEAWFFDGVPLFFIISGALVYQSADRCIKSHRPIRDYFTNRALRIMPAIYVYAIVTPIVFVVIGAIAVGAIVQRPFILWEASNAILAPIYRPVTFAHIGDGAINGSLWTIPVEVSFYIVLPLAVLIERRYGFRTLLSAVAVVALVGLMFGPVKSRPGNDVVQGRFDTLLHYTFLPHMVFFGAGIFWYRYAKRLPKAWWLPVVSIAAYIAIRYTHLIDHNYVIGTIAWVAPLSLAVIWVGLYGPKAFQRLTGRIGDLSFGVYIWHMVVVNVFLYYGFYKSVPGWAQPFAVLGIVAISLVCGFASWWLIEKRALQRKPFSSRNQAELVRPQ